MPFFVAPNSPTHPDIQPQFAADQAYLARVQLQVGALKHFLVYTSHIPVFHGAETPMSGLAKHCAAAKDDMGWFV